MYTDKTGAFPVTSKKGNKYITILCEIDNGVIMSEAVRNRSSSEIVRVYQVLMQQLKAAGIRPKKHVLDNECSTDIKQAIKENELEYQIVPKGQHRRNISERALQTWKSHTIGSLSGVSNNFPFVL